MPLAHVLQRSDAEHLMTVRSIPNGVQINWPKLHTVFQQLFSQQIAMPAGVTSAEAIAMIKREGSRCTTAIEYLPDIGVYDELVEPLPSWEDLLTNMYWRAFRQAGIWALFCHLLQKGLINLDSLSAPMNLLGLSHQTNLVGHLLACFPFVHHLLNESLFTSIPYQTSVWSSDLDWLATAISRHGAYVPRLLSEIEATGIFGKIDNRLYEIVKEKLPSSLEIPRSEHDGKKRADSRINHVFAFWLPHGISSDPGQRNLQLKDHIRRGNDIFRHYEDMIEEQSHLGLCIVLFDVRGEDDPEEGSGEFSFVQVSAENSGVNLLDLTSAEDDHDGPPSPSV